MKDEITVSAPGKLMLLGEWSVLELGSSCLVAAINVRTTVHIRRRTQDGVQISAPAFGIKDVSYRWEGPQLVPEQSVGPDTVQKLGFLQAAFSAVREYIGSDLNCEVVALGPKEIDGKFGFGSSAAVTVATCGALLLLAETSRIDELTRHKIFKLSALSHLHAQRKLGSSFDIAASVYGGTLRYARFDPDAVFAMLEERGLHDTVDSEWPKLVIDPVSFPESFFFLVGFTGKSADTSALIKKVELYRTRSPEIWRSVCEQIERCVTGAYSALIQHEFDAFRAAVKENQRALSSFTQESGVPIETAELQLLAEVAEREGGIGKLSGAGGGDCGIAFTSNGTIAQKIREQWQATGISPLDVAIDQHGVREG